MTRSVHSLLLFAVMLVMACSSQNNNDNMIFDCVHINNNESNDWSKDGFRFRLIHKEQDFEGVNRIVISNGDLEVEILPSKGLSIGEANYLQKPFFWKPPIGLPNPSKIDLNNESVLIQGTPSPGFAYLETFMGGIEFYGMKNWGMPIQKEGKLQPLHGETSNIPVKSVELTVSENSLQVSGSFIYRSLEGQSQEWYEAGKALYKITQHITIYKTGSQIDTDVDILNLTEEELTPDWGYHITFNPTPGSELLIPSDSAIVRGGGVLPDDISTWQPATVDSIRTEIGIIHQGLLAENGITTSLLKHLSGWGIKISLPASPYFQTWFCNGGANSKEFTYSDGTPIFKKNWDGQGIEIGSSSLDHDDNVDPTVMYQNTIKPNEVKTLSMSFQMVEGKPMEDLENKIRSYEKAIN